ncbi:gem-associated protein 8-like [Macrosteles quadrilineatus]|uniref:gem-associated protein 8-like n=1 Tax=Macrosteles quadrilineatus TaxID=74068 RepID=UPI0023E28180|nr:gem-associated protein 8-like [Macrosteles quadrilineatus]XP_054263264.1 gem-associated protein 8-like [Macrosteles quadrilineatus]
MAYYERSETYYDYGDYQSDSRRTSNSFSEEMNGAKRKKTNWRRGRRGKNSQVGESRRITPRNVSIDTPLFQEPIRPLPPPPPPRNPSPRNLPPLNDGRKRGRERSNSFQRANPQPYFDMRDMPEFVEPEHVAPSWEWENYVRGCRDWQDKHKLAYYQSRCTALEFENQMLFDQINQLIKENIVFAAERGKTPTMEVPEIPGLKSPKAKASNSRQQGKRSQPTSDLGLNSDIEFNLTEDVVEFLETSIRHKLTLKKEKIEKKNTTADSRAKEGEKKVEASPKKPALKRKEELEQFYGKNSNLIQGLETSLQLSFNRNCDTFKPMLYPAVPLNQETVVA